jgi:uncharacterized protein DUF4440
MTSASEPQTESDLIRTTEHERLRALVDGNVALASPLHADDFQLINPLGGALSKEQYLGAVASGDIDYRVWEPGAIEVRLYGEAAIIRYQSKLEIVVQGRQVPPRSYWHTDSYERRNGRWQVVWSQATAIE